MSVPQIPTAEVAANDVSVKVLNSLFGEGWHALLPGGDTGATTATNIFFPVLEKFNTISWAAVGILFAYTMALGIAGTAHSGEPLGKRYSTLWTPLRFAFANAMLAPVVKGLSIFQVIILASVGFSTNFANWVWSASLDYLQETGGRVSTTLPGDRLHEGYTLAQGILQGLVLQEHRVVREGYSLSGSGVSNWQVSTTGGGETSYRMLFQAPVPEGAQTTFKDGDYGSVLVVCGSDEGGEGGTLASMGVNACTAMRNSVVGLITDLHPVARAIVTPDADPDPRVFLRAVSNYNARYSSAMQSHVLNRMSAAQKEELNSFVAQAKGQGWLTAGIYYWTIARVNEKAGNLMNMQASYSDGAVRDIQEVSLEISGSFVRLKKLLSDAAGPGGDLEGMSDLASLEGADDGVFAMVKSYLSAPLRKMTMVMVDTLSEDGDPLVAMSSYGHHIIGVAEGLVGASIVIAGAAAAKEGVEKAVGKGPGKVLKFFTGAFDAVGKLAAAALFFLAIPIFVLGFVWAYYLPSLPFILFLSGFCGWLILVVEALVAAPLWIAAHAMPEGDGMAGEKGKAGYMLLLNILMRPPLMVAGVWAALFLVDGLAPWLGKAMKVFMYSVTGGTMFGVFSMFAMITIFTILLYILSHKLFGLIVHLPDSVIRWVGGGAASLGEHADENRARSIFAAVGHTSQGASSAGVGGMKGKAQTGVDGGSKKDALGRINDADLAQTVAHGGGGGAKGTKEGNLD